MREKNIIQKLACVLFVCLFFDTAAQAEEEKLPPLVVVVVDSGQVMSESTAVKQIQTEIEKERAKYQKEISEKESVLRLENEALMAAQKKLSPKEFEKKRKNFENQVEAVKTLVDERRKNLELAYNISIGQVNDKFVAISEGIARKKGALLAIQRTIVIWLGDPRMDVTKDVTLALNKELPSVTVSFSALPEKKLENNHGG